MARYNFDLKNKEIIDNIRSPAVYAYNMAQNLALLSNDASVIRRFYQVEIPKYFKDTWLTQEAENKFLGHYVPGQAFAYFGIIPMIVNAKVNLVASNGFKCESDDEEIDEVLNELIDEAELLKKFCDGVYWESGIGDVAYRVSYCPEICDKPIIDIIEPQHLEVNYKRGKIKSFVVKEVSKDNPTYELWEIHYKNEEGYVCIDYRFAKDGKYVPKNDEALMAECRAMFPSDIDIEPRRFPLKDFLIIFKKNDNSNQLYKGERGVPDIQGMQSNLKIGFGAVKSTAGVISQAASGKAAGAVGSGISAGLDVAQTLIDRSMTVDNMKNAPDQLKNANGNVIFNMFATDLGLYVEKYSALEGDLKTANDFMNLYGFTFNSIANVKDYAHIRKYHNYVKAQLQGIVGNISNTARDDLRQRFASGIRFWNQDNISYQYENYELWLED